MNGSRRKGSDSDASVVSSKSMARKKAALNASEKVPSPKKFGRTKASSIRSYRMDDDGDDERDIPRTDRRLSIGAADSPRSRNSVPRTGYNALYSDMNPYAALRIAGTPRASSDVRPRIADTHLNSKTSTSGNDDLNTDPYVALKVAGSHLDDFGDEIVYDSNDSSGTEEEADVSNNSDFEQVDAEGESGSEEGDDEYTNNARVSVAGSESGQAKEGGYAPGYARVSVAGSESGQGKESGYAPGYARVSVAGSDHGKNVGKGFARVSVAGSEYDHARDRDEEFQRYAKISVPANDMDFGKNAKIGSSAGSESDHGRDSYPKVSVAGNDNYRGQDVYARLSVAGSAAEPASGVERESTGYARIYVSGSEAEYRNDFDRAVSGPESLTVHETKVGYGVEGQSSDEERKMSESDAQDNEQEAEDNECTAYLQLSPELQAKLQYRVRVVLISPRFEVKKRTLAAFFDLYRSKFGVEPGFSSVASLCRAMPSVIQRKQSEDNDEELVMVDSSQNRRAVSGIRSGLRRIVYDALRSLQHELLCSEFEEKCSELLGNPFGDVLSEHGYDPPTVESLVNDMPDIGRFKEDATGLESKVYLCPGAEDPALTDGLLVRSMTMTRPVEPQGVLSEVEDASAVVKESGQGESLKIGSSVTLRSLKNELRGPEGGLSPTSVSSLEEELLQVRLRMRILLAFYNAGHGIEATELQALYAKTFGHSFNLQELGFHSTMELARNWQEIFLLQEPKPGWVFLVPSQANRRILNTLRTGLRSSVFSVLVETYPEGLDPLDFLHRLQEGMSGELWEVLEATGYTCADAEKADSILSSSTNSDFQLVDFEEICVLLDDMIDFVRLGSNDDGSVVVKLRNGEVPLVDLLDCKLNEADMGSFDELFVNLMIIAVDDTETSGADSGSDGFISVGHVQSLVKSFEGIGGLRSAHSQATDALRLKHELRLILGSADYCDSGIALNELSNVYRGRTGQELGSKAKVKSLLRGMPDIVSKDAMAGGDIVRLCKTPKNQRVLSATRAGLRQILFWALVKNPGGVWANLLEGWFADFSGVSLSASLRQHGYETSKSKPFFPVYVFLREMSDLLHKKSAPLEIYTWAGDVKDPVHSDASLLGLSELQIQYDPLRFRLEKVVPTSEAGLVREPAEKSTRKEDEGCRDTDLVHDTVLESSPLKEGNVSTEAVGEEQPALSTANSGEEGDGDSESKLAHRHEDQASPEQERREEEEVHHVVFESRAELSNGNLEAPIEQKGTLESKEDFGEALDLAMDEEDQHREQHADGDVEDGPVRGENDEAAEEDGSHVFQIEGDQLSSNAEPYARLRVEAAEEDGDRLSQIDGDRSTPNAEAYAQLRVAGKGPKVNLDDWQFTDSEDEGGGESEDEEDEEDEEEEEEEEDEEIEDEESEEGEDVEEDMEISGTPNSKNVPGQVLAKVSSVGPNVVEAGKDSSRAWVLPNKGVPWK